ncbi:MAG TPA: hypothetical protein VGF85_00265 [Opitutaceae bacterium]|jgi:hypothetical protein
MSDREFIELLNLYVDREIGANDALRLEAEVGANPERRRVYDQYCRMQRACSRLASELATVHEGAERKIVDLPAPIGWSFRPLAAGLAVAACLCVVFVVKYRLAEDREPTMLATVSPDVPRTVPDTVELSPGQDSMKSVFTARLPSSQTGRAETAKPLFVMSSDGPAAAQLNWIGDVRLNPVFPSVSPDLLLAPKTELKTGITDDGAAVRMPQDATEMTAFRFQR